jgi:hypothetical protein
MPSTALTSLHSTLDQVVASVSQITIRIVLAPLTMLTQETEVPVVRILYKVCSLQEGNSRTQIITGNRTIQDQASVKSTELKGSLLPELQESSEKITRVSRQILQRTKLFKTPLTAFLYLLD